MRIIEVYLDGYKNIVNTRLDFSEQPILCMIAPNNFGKTNLLNGIFDSFKLLRRSGSSAANYVRYKSYESVVSRNPNRKFTFEVKFQKRPYEEGKVYHYRFVIDCRCVNYASGEYPNPLGFNFAKYDKEGVYGVCEESLSFIKDGKTQLLFERNVNDPNEALVYYGKVGEDDIRPSLSFLKYNLSENHKPSSLTPPSFWLFFRTFGLIPAPKNSENKLGANCPYKLADETFWEIYEAFVSITRDHIGAIIDDETTSHNDFCQLSKAAEFLSEENKSEFEHFKANFQSIFPFYGNVELAEIAHNQEMRRFWALSKKRKLIPTGHNHPMFYDTRKDSWETMHTLSFGARRIFKLLSELHANDIPLISIEELENGMSPAVYSLLLNSVFKIFDRKNYDEKRGYLTPDSNSSPEEVQAYYRQRRSNEPSLIVTSHSPYIASYFIDNLDALYIGLTCEKTGKAEFQKLSELGKKKIKEFVEILGSAYGLGEIIINALIDPEFAVEMQNCLEKS